MMALSWLERSGAGYVCCLRAVDHDRVEAVGGELSYHERGLAWAEQPLSQPQGLDGDGEAGPLGRRTHGQFTSLYCRFTRRSFRRTSLVQVGLVGDTGDVAPADA